jgi:tRNA (mo5U34)-methyltransferase
MQRGSAEIEDLRQDYDFFEQDHFRHAGYPKLHFVEHCYSGDETNWWIPNAACSAAMLRSAGFKILTQPEEEVFICSVAETPSEAGAIYPAAGPSRGA